MVWQDAFSSTGGPTFDAEGERERRLAAQARAGAEWALTALIARYQPTVVRYLTRLCGNQAQAQRLAERIFQRMERRLHGPHGAENLRLWLLRACTEAGLDTLRRPDGATRPRLGPSGVAGLLTEVSGKDSSGLLQSGLRRLRKVSGSADRQARPLVWAEESAAADETTGDKPGSDPSASGSHLDENLDRLDPRDALRHRLVRVTLAELPYGDAQCLALHLVAGLNQAEVARALGITNSAARKRIVHGLALFSDRYAQAVQSLGLPVELGFGDAIPRAPSEREPVEEPAPAPVVVSSQASDDEQDTSGEDRLIEVNRASERGTDVLTGVAYLSEDSGETAAVPFGASATVDPSPAYDAPYDSVSAHGLAADAHEGGAAFAPERPRHTPIVAVADEPAQAADVLIAERDPAPVSGGLITRVAADAIVGPVIDALPVVTTAGPVVGDPLGLAAPRSMPLAFELSSNTSHEPQGFTMNWLDDAGMMTPLTFESVAIASGALLAPNDGETLDEGAPLTLEAVTLPPDAATDDAPAAEAYAAEAEAVEAGAIEYELAAPLVEEPPDVEPESRSEVAPIVVPVLSAQADDPFEPTMEELFPPRPKRGVTTRSLEAVWDDLSEGTDH